MSAPPFILHPASLIESPSYWAERPRLFAAAALQPDPAARVLAVLQLYLASLLRQCHVGRDPQAGLKKPLNPVLGETFQASWQDSAAECLLLAEQVSHHPPTTACYLEDARHGVRAQAHSTQSTTLNGTSVQICQSGHAQLTLVPTDTNAISEVETYLLPLPTVQVRGFFSGTPYPELTGSYKIVSSTGCSAEIVFGTPNGRGSWFGFGSKSRGDRDAFTANIYGPAINTSSTRPSSSSSEVTCASSSSSGSPSHSAYASSSSSICTSSDALPPKSATNTASRRLMYTVSGTWTREFVIHRHYHPASISTDSTKPELEPFSHLDPLNAPSQINLAPKMSNPSEQQSGHSSHLNSRSVWGSTISALERGDIPGVMREKARVENEQRLLRQKEKKEGKAWESCYFERRDTSSDKADDAEELLLQELLREMADGDRMEMVRLRGTNGSWRYRKW